MVSERAAPIALCLIAAWLGACETVSCPLIARPALDITIQHCVYAGQALYGVVVEDPEGMTQTLACGVGDSGACSCSTGFIPGEYRVTFTVAGLYAIEEQVVTVGQHSCGLVTTEVVYEGAPIAELPRAACDMASEHLSSCGFSPDEARCVKNGLRAEVPESGAAFATVSDCLDECVSHPSCDELSRDLCAPAEDVTELELCWGDCLDLSGEDVADYAPELGPSSYCGLGGAGGDGG